MSLESLISQENSIEYNNTDAAILIQLILQFTKPSFTSIYFPLIIESVIKRLEENPTSNCLNFQLLNIIFSCICSDMDNTLLLLEKQFYLIKFFDKISQKIDYIKNNYDQKIMVIGLSTLLTSVQLFKNNKAIYTNLLMFALKLLQSLQLLEIKTVSKKDLKQIEDRSRSFSREKSDLNEKNLEIQKNDVKNNIKRLKNLKYLKKMKKNALRNHFLDENDPEKLDLLYDTIKYISSKINIIDEFLFFSSCLKFAEQSGIRITSCLDLLGEKMTTFLYQMINVRRIDIENSDLKITSIRRIVTAKRTIARSEIILPNCITPTENKKANIKNK